MIFPTQFPILDGEKINLRMQTSADLETIFYLRSDLICNQFIKREFAQNLLDAELHLNKITKGFINNNCIDWAICLKDEDKMIGSICLWNLDFKSSEVELGYALHTDFHNKGIMYEAAKMVCAFAKQNMHTKKISAYTQFNNTPSIALLSKLKFVWQEEKVDEDNLLNRIYELDLANDL